MYKRKCPLCDKELVYKHKYTMNKQDKNNKLCKSCTVKKEYAKNTNKNKGNNNGRYGKRLIDIMINNYGIDNGSKKYEIWKKNLNKFKSGVDNPQFGKTPFKNGGMSYKGWYNGLFFRSSIELLFLVDKNEKMISGESFDFRISYSIKDKEYHYYPDFYSLADNTIYEIKSRKWVDSELNKIKIKYASDEFKKRGISYIIICEDDIKLYYSYNNWDRVIYDFLYEMVINKSVELTDISLKKLKSKLLKINRIEKLNKLNMKY